MKRGITAVGMISLLACAASPARGVDVTDWFSINNLGVASGSVTDGTTNSPTITGDGVQVIGEFPDIAINDGEFIRLTATMHIINRTNGPSFPTLANQVRAGLFRTADPPVAEPQPGRGLSGIIMPHRAVLRELHLNPANPQNAPFNSGGASNELAGSWEGLQEGTFPSGANVTLHFDLQLVRNADSVDIAGTIGDDLGFYESFSFSNHESPMEPADFFRWDSVGFLIGGNVDATSVMLEDVVVTTGVAPPDENADFDGDGDVDGADFLAWQRNVSINDGSANLEDGDANGDGNVNGDDLAIWEGQFGAATPNASAIPEPASLALAGMALAAAAGAAVRRRVRA